ncbi:MAG: helix-turn-helix transcriptional regulator [Lentisphaeria bacterium]|nr:helix-turn-helix transcriptional regulator [Lentisphaeria bacterium]MBR7143513.1 helix-turn-helix transcriptional regulator [Lentisphaeria bacterium]
MDLLEISQAIRKLRLQQGLTVEMLAKKSGFSKGFISQVENFPDNAVIEGSECHKRCFGRAVGGSAYQRSGGSGIHHRFRRAGRRNLPQ